MNGSLHHLRARHRKPPTPSTRLVRVMDKIIYVAAFVAPLFTLDQLSGVWIHHNAQGVSIVTWSALAFFSAVWLFYGYVHKDKAIIIANFLWVVCEGLVALGAYIYR